jgi:hypothetical protein
MTDKTYMVRFKPPEISTQHMSAASAEVYGDHLVFLNSNEETVAFFPLEIVESWTVTNLSQCAPEGFAEFVESGGGSARLGTAPMKID